MYIKDTFVDKAAEGKSKVLEFGVYILETLGVPAEQVAAALLSFRNSSEKTAASNGKSGNSSKKKNVKLKRRRKRQSGSSKNRTTNSPTETNVVLIRRGGDHVNVRRRNRYEMTNGNNDLLHRALRFVIEARSSSPQQVISRILFYLADALGETLDQPSQRDLERVVGRFVETVHSRRGNRAQLERLPPPLCRAMTGVVLSYQEREDLAPSAATLNRIRRGMHFDIPIRPFDATVQLLPPPNRRIKNNNNSGSNPQEQLCIMDKSNDGNNNNNNDDDDDGIVDGMISTRNGELGLVEENDKFYQQRLEEQDLLGRMINSRVGECGMLPCTPQSFPPTPESRTQLLGDYSEFTENVLWRARDELRGEQEENDRTRMAIFNPEDAHPKLLLSCGGHCVSLDSRNSTISSSNPNAERIYRSVRAALTFQYGRTIYFEFCPVSARPTTTVGSSVAANSHLDVANDLHVCVGLSTKSMPLRNTVPGCSPKTIGLDSSGVMLFSGRRTRTTGFKCGSVVGICVRAWISHLKVAFFIDGKQVHCDAHDLGVNLCDEDNVEFKDTISSFNIKPSETMQQYYPTVSIKSKNVKVFGHFSNADMRHPTTDTEFWREIGAFVPDEPIYALDGTRLL